MKEAYMVAWNPVTKSLIEFSIMLDRKQKKLAVNKVIISDKDKLNHFVEQMYSSNTFDRDTFICWEDLLDDEKESWKTTNEYFENKHSKIKTSNANNKNKAKNVGYKSTALMKETNTEAKEEVREEQP